MGYRPNATNRQVFNMAEGVGFEPTVLSYNGFQDRRLKPLGHPSLKCFLIIIQFRQNVKNPLSLCKQVIFAELIIFSF